jgi:hypothetical protein
MARVNIGNHFGTWIDGGGGITYTNPEILKLYDGTYNNVAKVVPASGFPNCKAGYWTGGTFPVGIQAGTTALINNLDNRKFLANGIISQVAINGRNSGSGDLRLKFKAFRPDGIGGAAFVGESNWLIMPPEAELRTHDWYLTDPFSVEQNDWLAVYFASGSGTPVLSSPGQAPNSTPCIGNYIWGDVAWNVRVTDFIVEQYHAIIVPSGVVAYSSSYNVASIIVDLENNYKCRRLEVFIDKYANKDAIDIYTSDDGEEWLEWIDHKFYTRWDSVPDGNENITFLSTKGVVYASIEGAPRFYKIDVKASAASDRSVYEMYILNDDQYINFKPSDWDLMGGNWIGPRNGTLVLAGMTQVDLTTPCTKDGYIYGFQLFGKNTANQKLRFYVFRDRGLYLEMVDTSLTISEIPAMTSNQIIECALQYPIKVREGDYIGIYGHSALSISYDANATSSAPLTDPSNQGNGTIYSGITVNNSTTKTEDWTFTCTNADTPGQEEWTIVGSISLEQAAKALTGIQYTSDDSEIQFMIQSGSNPFRVDDKIYVSTVKQGITYITPYINVSDTPGTYIDKDEFTQVNNNLAIKVYQNIYTDQVWCADAEVGIPGEHETVRVYNLSAALAVPYVDITNIGDGADLIEISNDETNWYGRGDPNLPIKIKDRNNPAQFQILPGDYGNLYVRTNLESSQDAVKSSRVLIWWTQVIG